MNTNTRMADSQMEDVTMDIVTNESVTALARRLGNKGGWKERMPAMPPGLKAGGIWEQQRSGNVVRLRYREPGGAWQVIGQWPADEPEAAPGRNGTGPRPPQPDPDPVPGVIAGPDPMIFLTPAAGGAWRLNAYGVDAAAVIRALRLALVHLVARQAGVLIIDEVIAPEMAVVATERLPRLPQPRSDKQRGSVGRVKRMVRYPADDEEFGEGDW